MLSNEMIEQYKTLGYAQIEGLLSDEQVAQMKDRAATIGEQWVEDSPGHVFTTRDNDRTGDRYFLESAEEIRCFYEEEAFDAEGKLVQDRSQSINKIGHALHELDPVFEPISHSSLLGEIAAEVGMQKPQIRQSMYIFKQPRIGGVVKWHQDATFFYTDPVSVVTFWFAIEDATLENGCLWVQPGAHTSPLRERFNRDGDTTTMVRLDDTPWPSESEGVPLEVAAGSLVVFHGQLPHYSAPNRSDHSRQAYTLHVTDATATYADTNWLQTKRLPLRGFQT